MPLYVLFCWRSVAAAAPRQQSKVAAACGSSNSCILSFSASLPLLSFCLFAVAAFHRWSSCFLPHCIRFPLKAGASNCFSCAAERLLPCHPDELRGATCVFGLSGASADGGATCCYYSGVGGGDARACRQFFRTTAADASVSGQQGGVSNWSVLAAGSSSDHSTSNTSGRTDWECMATNTSSCLSAVSLQGRTYSRRARASAARLALRAAGHPAKAFS